MKRTSALHNAVLPALILLGALAGTAPARSQDTVTLEYCYRQVQQTWPLAKQSGLLDQASSLRTSNLGKNYLPQFNVNGSGSWQNEVTEVKIPLPAGYQLSAPEVPKDQYKLTLDVSQSIYDGHVTGYQKKLEKYNLDVDRKNIDATIYQLKDQVNQLYFGILLLQQSSLQLQESRKQLSSKLGEMESAVRNGAMLKMNADLIRAEIIRTDESLFELAMDRRSRIKMLGELISVNIAETAIFRAPVVEIPELNYENKRIENEVFNLQKDRISLQKNMVTTKWNPKFWAFGQFGLGKPGYNFLSTDIAPMVMVGARLTWNPWNWNANKNEKKIWDIQGDIVRNQQAAFDKNLRISAGKEAGEIMKLTDLIVRDNELIELRLSISRTASSQLSNGVITSSDYLMRLNEETQARLNMELHRVQLVRARYAYLYTLGKL